MIATTGENGFRETGVPRERRIAVRAAEQRAAAAALGVEEVVFLGYRDGFLRYTEGLRRRLVTLLRRYRPALVFSFDPGNQRFDSLQLFHRDHRVLARAVFDACFAAKNPWLYPGEPHRVEKLFLFGTDRPNHEEDITPFMERKLEILRCHASQFRDFDRVARFVREELSRRSSRYRWSEVFRVVEGRQIL